MNLIFTISFQIHATPLPQDTGSSLGGLFGSVLVGLGERAVQEGLADRVQELGLAGGQAVDSAISGGSRAAGTVGNQVVSNLPSREQVVDQVVSNLPSTDAVAEQVVANLPTTDDVASVLPSSDQVANQVVSNLPTNDQVVDALPPAEQVIESLPRDQIIDQVRGSLPSAEQVVEQVGPNLPTAEQ